MNMYLSNSEFRLSIKEGSAFSDCARSLGLAGIHRHVPKVGIIFDQFGNGDARGIFLCGF
eukprot:Awhi_evm1s10915